ncbi:hypothetical protein EDD17DRAFT_1898530 [Pisolithus thermaeus]|nr:hypothetical protein EDD17DRAFT_1898530 [Pisolithus thermaeus]
MPSVKALQPISQAGEMQTKTIIGIVVGLLCFILLVLSIWTISYCYRKRVTSSGGVQMSSVRIFCVVSYLGLMSWSMTAPSMGTRSCDMTVELLGTSSNPVPYYATVRRQSFPSQAQLEEDAAELERTTSWTLNAAVGE